MALNFPDNPSVNDIYRDTTSGFSYQWDGTVWQSYSDSSLGQIKILDDISGSFNGSTQTFALTSNSTAVTPANAQQIRVVLGGVVQDPVDDYTVSGSNITFTTPPVGALSFSGVVFGTAVPINKILDGTVTDGSLRISTQAIVGSATTFTEDLVVEGDARITGILTVGTSSITLDGSNNEIKIGTGITISSTGITGSASTVTSASVAYGLEGSPNLNVGVVTASSFVGDVTGDASGLSGTPNLNVGVVTATSFVGNLTGTASTATAAGTAYGLTGSPDITVGLATINGGINLNKLLRESVNITAGKLSDNTNINLENGMVHYFTTTETTTSTPNIRYNASTTLNSSMDIGDTIAVSIITTAAAAGYSANITIDGSAVTEEWLGGSAPTIGGSSGFDVYAFQIIKTANATFTVLASVNNFA